MSSEEKIWECYDCGCRSLVPISEKVHHCKRCNKTFDTKDYVKVSFEFDGKTSEEYLHIDQAWEVAQALKRMYQELLHPFMERHRRNEPEMLEGFKRIRRPLNEVGIDPR